MFWIRGVSWAQPMPAFLALLGISLSAPALLLAETLAFCGGLNGAPKEIFLDTNVATIRFESGLHVSGRGFLLNYASSDHPDLITCLARSNHYEETEYSRYCPAGCRDIAGDVSGDVVEGYRDTSLLCKAAIHAGVIADELGGQIHLIQHKGASRYQGVLANGIVSKDGSLSDRRFVFNSLDCSNTLTARHGSEGVSATSSWESSSGTGETIYWSPEKAQLNMRGASWASNHQVDREWLEIDLGEKKKITAHNSSTHPMWEKTNVRVGQTPMKEEKTITEPVPSEETDLGWKIIAIIVPLVLFVCLLVAAICIFITRRKRLKAEAYGSADEPKSGCWKQLEQPFVRQQSAEFAISYNNEKDTLKKFDLITCDMEDFQQSLMIGTGTVTRKGSTFKPMDTEAKDTLGTQEIENHYDCPHRSNRHEYALPLTNPEPEYATPIIERHLMRENTFTSEAGYNIPVVSLDRQKSFSAVSFSISSSPEHSGGDYQTPQCINKEEGDYDRPKVHSSWAAMENGDYQKPHICSLVTDGYSSPRDCLKPINQTAITAPL
ncbi:hypothetical protein FKM82_010980 [Ascaphus truei]